MTRSILASDWLNGFILYGGELWRRIDVIRDLREKGLPEQAIGWFVLKPTVMP